MCKHCEAVLKGHEENFIKEMEPFLESIRLVNVHWGLEQYLDTGLRMDMNNPKPNTTYILWDHKAPMQGSKINAIPLDDCKGS